MSEPNDVRKDGARRKAQNYFAKAEQRDVLLKQEKEKAKAADVAKMARLRGLRLAKEAADKEIADQLAASAPVKKTAAKK
jgi:hypothetical protein